MSPLFGNNHSILDVVVRFFDNDGWKYQLLDGNVIKLGFQGENGAWNCYAQAKEEREQFLFYSVLSASVPSEKRAAMAEYLTRANYGLILGNFEMDYFDGEIRYKTSAVVRDSHLDEAMVKHLVYTNVLTTDRYFPGIMKVIYSDIPPSEAIEQIEG